MPALQHDTRLVMTILFVGTVSGANVFFYASYGTNFPYTTLSHATLFGLITVGSIMILKAIFDLALNEKIEMYLLDRRVNHFWAQKRKEEEQKGKIRETMKNYTTTYNTQPQFSSQMDTDGIGNEFLAAIEQ
tara:strand:- start:1343 stop:1738 length:396 start_codon:yes stop_codon:yes gene_type:complete